MESEKMVIFIGAEFKGSQRLFLYIDVSWYLLTFVGVYWNSHKIICNALHFISGGEYWWFAFNIFSAFFCGVIQFLAIWLSCALVLLSVGVFVFLCFSVFFFSICFFYTFFHFILCPFCLSLSNPLSSFSSHLSFSISISISVSFHYFILEQCRYFYCFSSALKRIYENWFSFGLWLTTHIRHVFIYIGTFAMGDIVLLSFYSTYLSKAK